MDPGLNVLSALYLQSGVLGLIMMMLDSGSRSQVAGQLHWQDS